MWLLLWLLAASPVEVKAGICVTPACAALFGTAPTAIRVQVRINVDAGVDTFTYGVDCDEVTVAESKVDYREHPAPLYYRDFRIDKEDAGLCVGWARIRFVDGRERLLKSREMRVERADQ